MKKKNNRMLLGSLAIAGAMFVVPVATYADTASSSVHINQAGTINLSSVEVTSISGNIINSLIKFKNILMPVIITTNASTTIKAGTSTQALVTDIKVGDKLHVSGLFTGFTTGLTMTANTIKDVTSFASFHNKSGVVQSVNLTNNSFVIKTSNNKLVTIQNNASTTFFVGNKATSTLALTVLVNSKVEVRGLSNTDGTIVTASKVTVKKSEIEKNKEKKEKREKDNNKDKSKNGNSGKSDSHREDR